MCGRYEIQINETELAEIIAEVERKFPGETIATGEVFPTNTAPVFVADNGSEPLPLAAKWGFPQFGGKKGVIINARAETVEEKPTFRKSFLDCRCAVPASGFFEWTQERPKQKYRFTLPEQNVLYLAGIAKPLEALHHFVVLTTMANASMSDIHHRMPVLIGQDQLTAWLTDDTAARQILASTSPVLQRQAV